MGFLNLNLNLKYEFERAVVLSARVCMCLCANVCAERAGGDSGPPSVALSLFPLPAHARTAAHELVDRHAAARDADDLALALSCCHVLLWCDVMML